MTVYMVAQVLVQDPEQWEHYKEIAAREIAQHGGRYLARGASPEVEEADWTQPEDLQINIVAFPSLEQAHAWYRSPEYAEALAFRKVAVQRRLFFVQGIIPAWLPGWGPALAPPMMRGLLRAEFNAAWQVPVLSA